MLRAEGTDPCQDGWALSKLNPAVDGVGGASDADVSDLYGPYVMVCVGWDPEVTFILLIPGRVRSTNAVNG